MALAMRVVLCVWLVLGCDGVAVDTLHEHLGQNLGLSIRRLTDSVKAHENMKEGAGFAVQQESAAQILAQTEVVANEEVERVIERANRIADTSNIDAGICLRNWTFPCPDGWDVMSNSVCMSPLSYQGGCGHLQQFADASTETKASFAASCKAPWPCLQERACAGGNDYDQCPLGWSPVSDGFCQGSPTGSGCSGLYNFMDMEVGPKQELSVACNLKWRCRTECARDISAPCPEGWTDVMGLCVAPVSYAGDCDRSVNMSAMSQDERHAFVEKCLVRFPCAPHSRAQGSAEKRVDTAKQPTDFRSSSSGAVDPQTGDVAPRHGSLALGQGAEEASLKWRFALPSGPLDGEGGIHF